MWIIIIYKNIQQKKSSKNELIHFFPDTVHYLNNTIDPHTCKKQKTKNKTKLKLLKLYEKIIVNKTAKTQKPDTNLKKHFNYS